MSQWSLKERLQPSLLDRLTDLKPEKKKESTNEQTLGQRELKEAVIRDLGWLLNSVALDVIEDLERYERVQKSVVNYGLPDLSGHTASSVKPADVEAGVRDAIRQYEPRIIRNSLKVKVRANLDDMSHNSVVFEIEGAIFGQPAPFQVMLQTELDLESGNILVKES
jgi:type VI secretion system protein ImpF